MNKVEESVIVAVDAVDYTKGLLTKNVQYSRKFVRREMHKFFVGLDQVLDPFTDPNKSTLKPIYRNKPARVFTGRWGCGVFGAD